MRRSATLLCEATDRCRVLVIGGGSAGLGISSKLARKLPKGDVTIVEPNTIHYYQPGYTLMGVGQTRLDKLTAAQKYLIPNGVRNIEGKVATFMPESNKVVLANGRELSYEMLVITTGLQLRYDMIEGAWDALNSASAPVCSIYLPHLSEKCYRLLNEIRVKKEDGYPLMFTFPATPVKCAGAPQKIMYLAWDMLKQSGLHAKCSYYTAGPRLFGVDKYEKSLLQICQQREIDIHRQHNLVKVEVLGGNRGGVATYKLPDGTLERRDFRFLHIGPPSSPIKPLRECPALTDANGWVDVNAKTLQSNKFSNVFAIGDCTNTPNSKTAAAISSQLKVAGPNILAALEGGVPTKEYDGYASCPLLVSHNKVILAEFGPNGPMETMPFDQSKPSYISFIMKKYFMPWLYWHGLIKGVWNGPAQIRRILNVIKSSS